MERLITIQQAKQNLKNDNIYYTAAYLTTERINSICESFALEYHNDCDKKAAFDSAMDKNNMYDMFCAASSLSCSK